MGAEEEDAGILVEDVLGAVAVVHVPIGDEHAFDAVDFAGVARGDGCVVEDAEAHAAGGGGVMAGGTDGGEGVADAAAHDGVNTGEGSAGCQGRHFQRVLAEGGIAGAEGGGFAG
jgi:hypothetical protein